MQRIVDATGVVVAQYDYDAFGNIRRENSYESIPNRYTFQGREWDAHAAHYHYRFRTYIPEWGSFTGPDMNLALGVLGEPNGMGNYLFCNNNPVVWTDPEGLEVWVEAERGLDDKGMLYITRWARYEAIAKRWVYRDVGSLPVIDRRSTERFDSYKSEFGKMMETQVGSELYSFVDAGDDRYVRFGRTSDGSPAQVAGPTMTFDPDKYLHSPTGPGYSIITHEFQHVSEGVAMRRFLKENEGRTPNPTEWSKIHSPIAHMSSEYHQSRAESEAPYRNWLGETATAILATSSEARAVRAQNVVVMQYNSLHGLEQQTPIEVYPGEGVVHDPVPQQYWTDEYVRFRDRIINNRQKLRR